MCHCLAFSRHAAEELQQSLAEEQAHSRSLLLQLQQLEASKKRSVEVIQSDDNQGSSDVEVCFFCPVCPCTCMYVRMCTYWVF